LALLWLQEAGLIYKIHRTERPGLPISHYDDLNAFKIYLFDIGILRSLSGLEINTISNSRQIFTHFKGAFAENYVLQSLISQFEVLPRYWTSESIAEVDFLIQYRNLLIPIEVKSGENTKSRSLISYAQKYKPRLKIRYSLKNLEFSGGLLNIPIFLADKTKEMIDTLYDQLPSDHTTNQ
jgi:predicted AAA+ superfamily ATPase